MKKTAKTAEKPQIDYSGNLHELDVTIPGIDFDLTFNTIWDLRPLLTEYGKWRDSWNKERQEQRQNTRWGLWTTSFDDREFTTEQLRRIKSAIKVTCKADKEAVNKLRYAIQTRENAEGLVPSLVVFERMLVQWLLKHCNDRGWLYYEGNAYVPCNVRYVTGTRQDDIPYVSLKLYTHAVTMHSDNRNNEYEQTSTYIRFEGADVVDKPVSRILSMADVYAESAEQNAEYDEQYHRWKEIFYSEPLAYTQSEGEIRNGPYNRDAVRLDPGAPATLVICNESYTDVKINETIHSDVLHRTVKTTRKFETCAYDLQRHDFYCTNTKYLQPVQYNPNLDSKLVLPELHSKLVRSFVKNFGETSTGDIVDNKNSGSLVLCIGKFGTGKTLTAECVSHILQRPLYRVNFGYLMGNSENRINNVESRLQWTLKISRELHLVPLLDEADVIITQRNPLNLEQSAIVGVVLPIFEYYSGLLFLTSNQTQNLDGAVISRMSAVIRYTTPEEDDRYRMWQIQNAAQELGLTNAHMAHLSKKIKCTGRLITRLAQLTKKYAQAHKLKITPELILELSVFQDVELERR